MDLEQVDVNKIEAASSNRFVSDCRPVVGWLDVAGLAYQFLVSPLMQQAWAVGQVVDLIPQGLSVPPDPDVEHCDALTMLNCTLNSSGSASNNNPTLT
jgi:hypothetical protein